jgi:hypothetical protein
LRLWCGRCWLKWRSYSARTPRACRMPPRLARQGTNQRRQHGPVRPRQARPTDLTTQHGDFVAQHQHSAAIAVSPRVARGNQPNIRTAVRYIRRTSTLSIVRDGPQNPSSRHVRQFWRGTGRTSGGRSAGSGVQDVVAPRPDCAAGEPAA